MKRTKIAILSLLTSVGIVLGVAAVGHAQWSDNIQSNDRVTVAADEVRTGSLYAVGDQIIIEGTVEGDLYCAGRELILSGTVTGDVLCAVQTATINGNVGQDARLVGQYLTMHGDISGSVTFFGQDLKLSNDASIGGDLNGGAQFVTLGGPIRQDMVIGSQKLTIQSTVGGDANVVSEQVVFYGGAKVAGDFNYTANQEVSINDAFVDGEIHFNPAEQDRSGVGAAWIVFPLLSLALSALAIILLAPRFAERSQNIAASTPLMVSLVGFAALLGLPILAVALMTTVILLPLGLLVLAVWMAALLVSHALVAYVLGSLFWRQQNNVVFRALAGIVVLVALYLIPGINVLTAFASLVFGMGMAFTTLFHGYQRPKYTLDDVSKVSDKE